MNAKRIVQIASLLMALLVTFASVALAYGLMFLLRPDSHPFQVELRLPAPETIAVQEDYQPIQGELTPGEGLPGSPSESWSQFRGDRHDAVYSSKIPLKTEFPEEGPPKLWSIPLGEGYAGPAVRNGCVYLLDYDMANYRDALRCLSLEDGREIWRYSYPVRIKKNHGMSRTIPAVTDKYCVSLGPKCHVLCVDARTGEQKWFLDLVHQYGTTEPEWYAGQCPLIVQEQGVETVVLAPAGPEVLLMGLDCETGQERWRTPNPFGWTMTHVSIMPMTLDGRNTYVYCGKGGVVGVDASDGTILWSTTDWQIEIATCPSPVLLPENRIFCCGGYLSGSVMLRIVPDSAQAGGYRAETVFRLKDAIFGSEQQTPVFYENHLFGVRQRDKEFVCLSLDGKVQWHSGSKGRFGGGPYLLVKQSDKNFFLLLDDNGKLTACEASVTHYRPLFEAQVLDDHGCWAPMALVDGKLLLRDQVSISCLDLK